MRDQIVSGQTKAVLYAFSRALGRESHILTQHPDLLWQQFYNRLQWEGEEVKQTLTPELTRHGESDSRPWLHLKNPHRESKALLRTLTGHTDGVTDCAFSPDGHLIVSASWDSTLRVWDAATGSFLHILALKGNANWASRCAFTLDGHIIASTIQDDTLRMWDASTGQTLDVPEGFTNLVDTFTFQPDLSLYCLYIFKG